MGYLAQHSLFDQVPSLRADISLPDYVTCTLDDEEDDPAETTVNAWIGPGGTVSSTHTDPRHNLFCQVPSTMVPCAARSERASIRMFCLITVHDSTPNLFLRWWGRNTCASFREKKRRLCTRASLPSTTRQPSILTRRTSGGSLSSRQREASGPSLGLARVSASEETSSEGTGPQQQHLPFSH